MTIQVRKGNYRGEDGFIISGHRTGQQGGWSVKIFTRTRESAEIIRKRVNAGEEIQKEDWNA